MIHIILFSIVGLLIILSEIFDFKKYSPLIVLFGIISSLIVSALSWNIGIFGSGVAKLFENSAWKPNQEGTWFMDMISDDSMSKPYILISVLIFALWFAIFYKRLSVQTKIVEMLTLSVFAMVGGFCLLSFSNLAMMFLGVEILSIPVYIMVGSRKESLKSNEASFKYFLMGAFASGILLFGMTFLYGATGQFDTLLIGDFAQQQIELPILFKIGLIMVIFALAFKVSLVPFHFWTPDVYEGAPTPITAFMATLVKGFAIGAFFRFMTHMFGNDMTHYGNSLIALSMITMIFGNLLGAVQDNPKRLLAYSGISHAGFMLIAVVIGGERGAHDLLYYITAYSVASLLAFYVFDKVIRKDDFYKSVGDFGGLFKHNNLLAFGLTVAMFSMSGIPPFSGFFAKYFIFHLAFQHGNTYIVIVGIIASLIGVYYYFKFIRTMYIKNPERESFQISLSTYDYAVLYTLIGLVIILGLMPDLVLELF